MFKSNPIINKVLNNINDKIDNELLINNYINLLYIELISKKKTS
jgi:hypothetical protein